MTRLYLVMAFIFIGLSVTVAKAESIDSLTIKIKQLYSDKKYKEAIVIGERIIKMAVPAFADSSYSYAQSITTLAFCYQEIYDYPNAERVFKKAISIWGKLSGLESMGYATANSNLATLYTKSKQYGLAEPLYINAITIIKRIAGVENETYLSVAEWLASLYEKKYEYYKALSLLKDLMVIRQNKFSVASLEYAHCLLNISRVHGLLGDYNAELNEIKESIKIYTELFGEENKYLAVPFNYLGITYHKLGNTSLAELYYKECLKIVKKAYGENSDYYAMNRISLSYVYLEIGNYKKAEELVQQSLKFYKANIGIATLNYAANLDALGQVYWCMGSYSMAEPLYKQALEIQKKELGNNNMPYSVTLNNLATLHQGMGNYAEAEKLQKQSLAIKKALLGEESGDYAISLSNLGRVYISKKDYAKAEPILIQAASIVKKVFGETHRQYAQSLSELFSLYTRTENKTAINKYIFAGTEISFNNYRKNFVGLSDSEKFLFLEKDIKDFYAPISMLVNNESNSFNKQLFNQQIQLKGFVLSDGIRILEKARKNKDPLFQQNLSQWQTNKTILAKQYSQPFNMRMQKLDSLELVANEQEKQINNQSFVWSASQTNLQIGFSQIQKKLKQHEAAIEFVRFNYFRKGWTDSILYGAFLILPNDTTAHFVTICEEKELAKLLDNKNNTKEGFVKQLYRSTIHGSNNNATINKGDSLYKLVMAPLQHWLKGATTLYMAPAGLLNRIAFDALPIDKNTMLLDKFSIRFYSCIKQLAEVRDTTTSTNISLDAVLYGGINFISAATSTIFKTGNATILPDAVKRNMGGNGFTYLPGTLEEVNSIQALFASNQKSTQLLIDTFATEESFKSLSGHSPTIIHVSTHGFSLPNAKHINADENQFTLADNPLLRTGIVMAGANKVWTGNSSIQQKEDGILTAYEISNLDLSNTELVVLSACETALGDIKGTEGVFGLQRAFKLAGAKNMIMSLWQVPDKETVELMTIFYSHKLNGMSIYESFNKAKNAMRKKYAPYYWAAFVLIE